MRPQIVGIVMDGNGRWAEQRGLARVEGHRQGARAVFRTIEAALVLNIKHLILYAFSTENWKRPYEEVSFLFSLLKKHIVLQERRIMELGVRFCAIGRRDGLPADLVTALERLERKTAQNERISVYLALNYGGRAEIADAAAKLAARSLPITPHTISQALYAPQIAECDLIIRTAGEKRLSNFLLWQAAYAELLFLDVLWPDFGYEHFAFAVEEFSRRKRRFGGL